VGGEQHQRRAALGRLGETGDRIREPRPLMYAADAQPTAHAGVRVRHHDRPALVPGRYEFGPAGHQGVADREVAAADQPEDVTHAEASERLADRLGDEHAGHQRWTRANTRAGLPEPPTIGSGATTMTAP